MNEAIDAYFGGEKFGGLLLAGAGLALLGTAVALFPAKYELRAFAVTVGVWGLLLLGVGGGLFAKTDAQVAKLKSVERATMLVTEVPRMERVQATFVTLEYAWVGLIIAGALVGWRLKENVTVSGIALATVMCAALLLAFDVVAERRGAVYLAALKR